MLTLKSAHSFGFYINTFFFNIIEKFLNAFHYARSYAKADYSIFMNTKEILYYTARRLDLQ